ncbi:MAG: hypothetical protein QS2022_2230 [Candidatus Phytoplasma asteris]|uniref:Serine/threonine protein kinase n=1 Tax='Chrysanthemum coronarium' phytoplasma TaxID=1520703 RepID=A0ABQ0J3F0_9MOLU|nr:hypothetical protein ['Chrysanthemum coronarium' phytoplasma]TKA88002.1 MAG: hypothetical protein PLY_2220 [Periwinkle leaf yellowing phytoplasma]WEX19499.1 MAG: hypothetical protein QS2022_2230 [Candidatus Phytoplasma asteris]GAK74127.1 serine/threonine protein kinase ['Chrysanthemum coronarium' phytoplasma]
MFLLNSIKQEINQNTQSKPEVLVQNRITHKNIMQKTSLWIGTTILFLVLSCVLCDELL